MSRAHPLVLAIARRLAAILWVLCATAAVAESGTRWPQDYQGLWWNPAETGWGVGVFDQGGNTMSSVLFVYGADGKPTWYVAPNLSSCSANFPTWLAINCSGPIYQTTGPWFGAGPFTPSSVTVREAGQFQGYFTGALPGSAYPRPREMTLTYTIDGATVIKPRLQFQDVSGSSSVNFSKADSPFTDLWWNPDESGWGVGIFQYRGALFGVLFVYGVNGKPTWYIASLRETTKAADATERWFEGPVFATRGSWWFTSPFALSDVREAGTARIVFPLAGSNAALSYTIDGNSVQSVIRRLSSARP
ncbi:MAG TPA: hypothetical protein VF386_04015 [Usitatibacter sp.]